MQREEIVQKFMEITHEGFTEKEWKEISNMLAQKITQRATKWTEENQKIGLTLQKIEKEIKKMQQNIKKGAALTRQGK